MNLGELTPEEKVVLNAMAVQRNESWMDTFEYDYMKAQRYFASEGFFAKYKIDLYRHFEILQELSDKHIISIDCIASLSGPKRKTRWISLMEWAQECIETSMIDGPGTVDASLLTIFVSMSFDAVNAIVCGYEANHVVQLRFDRDYGSLSIKIDKEGWRRITTLHEGRTPYKVIKHAYEEHDKVITNDDLVKKGINTSRRYLKSQVFSDNTTVLALSPTLIELGRDSIMFKKGPVKLTLVELNNLKAKLNIFR